MFHDYIIKYTNENYYSNKKKKWKTTDCQCVCLCGPCMYDTSILHYIVSLFYDSKLINSISYFCFRYCFFSPILRPIYLSLSSPHIIYPIYVCNVFILWRYICFRRAPSLLMILFLCFVVFSLSLCALFANVHEHTMIY